MVSASVDDCPFCGERHMMGDSRSPEDCPNFNPDKPIFGAQYPDPEDMDLSDDDRLR